MADWQGNAEPEDLLDSSQRCVHGTYVGNWATGDYICGLCEDGISPEEYELIQLREETGESIKRVKAAWFSGLVDTPSVLPVGLVSYITGIFVAIGKLR